MSTTSTPPPPPLQQSRSPPNPQFLSIRPALSTTPSRDGRSRTLATPATPAPPDSITYDNFNDLMAQRMNDPSFTDHLARLNRITGSLSQHVTTLTAYSEKLGEVDQRQKTILAEVNEAKKSLEQDAQTKLSATVPVIKDQERVMANIEKRVASARMRLEEQSDTLADIDFQIAANRKEMSLPPPSTQNIISAPPLVPRDSSREQSRERSQSEAKEKMASKPGWNCIIQ